MRRSSIGGSRRRGGGEGGGGGEQAHTVHVEKRRTRSKRTPSTCTHLVIHTPYTARVPRSWDMHCRSRQRALSCTRMCVCCARLWSSLVCTYSSTPGELATPPQVGPASMLPKHYVLRLFVVSHGDIRVRTKMVSKIPEWAGRARRAQGREGKEGESSASTRARRNVSSARCTIGMMRLQPSGILSAGCVVGPAAHW